MFWEDVIVALDDQSNSNSSSKTQQPLNADLVDNEAWWQPPSPEDEKSNDDYHSLAIGLAIDSPYNSDYEDGYDHSPVSLTCHERLDTDLLTQQVALRDAVDNDPPIDIRQWIINGHADDSLCRPHKLLTPYENTGRLNPLLQQDSTITANFEAVVAKLLKTLRLQAVDAIPWVAVSYNKTRRSNAKTARDLHRTCNLLKNAALTDVDQSKPVKFNGYNAIWDDSCQASLVQKGQSWPAREDADEAMEHLASAMYLSDSDEHAAELNLKRGHAARKQYLGLPNALTSLDALFYEGELHSQSAVHLASYAHAADGLRYRDLSMPQQRYASLLWLRYLHNTRQCTIFMPRFTKQQVNMITRACEWRDFSSKHYCHCFGWMKHNVATFPLIYSRNEAQLYQMFTLEIAPDDKLATLCLPYHQILALEFAVANFSATRGCQCLPIFVDVYTPVGPMAVLLVLDDATPRKQPNRSLHWTIYAWLRTGVSNTNEQERYSMHIEETCVLSAVDLLKSMLNTSFKAQTCDVTVHTRYCNTLHHEHHILRLVQTALHIGGIPPILSFFLSSTCSKSGLTVDMDVNLDNVKAMQTLDKELFDNTTKELGADILSGACRVSQVRLSRACERFERLLYSLLEHPHTSIFLSVPIVSPHSKTAPHFYHDVVQIDGMFPAFHADKISLLNDRTRHRILTSNGMVVLSQQDSHTRPHVISHDDVAMSVWQNVQLPDRRYVIPVGSFLLPVVHVSGSEAARAITELKSEHIEIVFVKPIVVAKKADIHIRRAVARHILNKAIKHASDNKLLVLCSDDADTNNLLDDSLSIASQRHIERGYVLPDNTTYSPLHTVDIQLVHQIQNSNVALDAVWHKPKHCFVQVQNTKVKIGTVMQTDAGLDIQILPHNNSHRYPNITEADWQASRRNIQRVLSSHEWIAQFDAKVQLVFYWINTNDVHRTATMQQELQHFEVVRKQTHRYLELSDILFNVVAVSSSFNTPKQPAVSVHWANKHKCTADITHTTPLSPYQNAHLIQPHNTHDEMSLLAHKHNNSAAAVTIDVDDNDGKEYDQPESYTTSQPPLHYHVSTDSDPIAVTPEADNKEPEPEPEPAADDKIEQENAAFLNTLWSTQPKSVEMDTDSDPCKLESVLDDIAPYYRCKRTIYLITIDDGNGNSNATRIPTERLARLLHNACVAMDDNCNWSIKLADQNTQLPPQACSLVVVYKDAINNTNVLQTIKNIQPRLTLLYERFAHCPAYSKTIELVTNTQKQISTPASGVLYLPNLFISGKSRRGVLSLVLIQCATACYSAL
jgi:hypothetical protein